MKKDQASIQNRLGLLFFVMINQGFSAMFTPVNICMLIRSSVNFSSRRTSDPAERKVVLRERRAGMYKVAHE